MECDNCTKTNSVDYTNNVTLCSGVVKEPGHIKKDVIRYCVVRDDLKETFDMHIAEAMDLISLISESVSLLFDSVDLDRLTTYIKDKSNHITSNA